MLKSLTIGFAGLVRLLGDCLGGSRPNRSARQYFLSPFGGLPFNGGWARESSAESIPRTLLSIANRTRQNPLAPRERKQLKPHWLPGGDERRLSAVGWIALIWDIRHDFSDFCLHIRSQRKQRHARRTAIISVQIAGKFETRDAEFPTHAGGGAQDPLLFFLGEYWVFLFPGGINLVAGLRRTSSQRQHRAGSTSLERLEEGPRRAAQHLKANLPGARLDRRPWRSHCQRSAAAEHFGGDEGGCFDQ